MYTSRYTLSQMVDELNSRGFKTKAGAMFKSNRINSVLTNEKYTGVYIFNKSAKKDAYGRRNSHLQKDPSEIIRIEDGMPQIVDKELYEKAQEILKSRKKSKAVNKAKESYLLSGLIRCESVVMQCMVIVDKLRINHYMYHIDVVVESVQVVMFVATRK